MEAAKQSQMGLVAGSWWNPLHAGIAARGLWPVGGPSKFTSILFLFEISLKSFV